MLFAERYHELGRCARLRCGTILPSGCMIPYYRFTGQPKHGITVEDENFHSEITITLAQVTEFIAAAQEAKAVNVLALLLEYNVGFLECAYRTMGKNV